MTKKVTRRELVSAEAKISQSQDLLLEVDADNLNGVNEYEPPRVEELEESIEYLRAGLAAYEAILAKVKS